MKVALVLITAILAAIAVYRITTISKSSSRSSKMLALCLVAFVMIICFWSKNDYDESQTTAKKEAEEINVEVDNKSRHQQNTYDGYNSSFDNGYHFSQQPFVSHYGELTSYPYEKEHECWDCYGLQWCPRCAGNGRIEPDFGTLAWSEGRTIQCSYCNGTGRCPTCKGSGRLYY